MDKALSGCGRSTVLAILLLCLAACKADDKRPAAGVDTEATVAVKPAAYAPLPSPGEPPPPSATTVKPAPLFSGEPLQKAVVGESYDFQPTTTATSGRQVFFSISGKPAWAGFDENTGRLWGTPQTAHIGSHEGIAISASDGKRTQALAPFAITVTQLRKSNYGHYFATRYADTPADAAMLCEQVGVSGVVWRRTWNEIETRAGVYDFRSFDAVLAAIGASRNPQCQLWLFVEFKSFANSPVKNPCPAYLQAEHSGPNAHGSGAATCFMWEPRVLQAYVSMVQAAAARYDAHPRVEGLVIQESALGFNGAYSQDVADGGTYTAAAWRDALIEITGRCGAAFTQSRCMIFLNFLRGGQAYLHDISAAIAAVPDNRACLSGPDLLPDNRSLYDNGSSPYEVLVRHPGCRSNSAQNDSFNVAGCDLDCVFQFAVRGTFGDFPENTPRAGGVCVNSYLLWNHRVGRSATGQDWTDALPVIAAYPYGRNWYEQCVEGGVAP